jgi:hypothetical protein
MESFSSNGPPVVRHRRRGAIRRGVALVCFALLAIIAYAAYRYFSNRAGEAATLYIPADAMMVGTFDGTPSERQVIAFAKIEEALKSEGVSDLVASQLSQGLANNPLAKDVEPYVSKNAALAVWGTKSFAQTDEATFLAVSDTGKVEAALAKDCPQNLGGGAYEMSAQKLYAGIVGNYLVLASSEPRFRQILKVSQGALPSVASLDAYKSARAILPADSNLMIFVSPDLYAMSGQKPLSNAWCSLGAAVRDDGLALAFRYPQDKIDLSGAAAFDQKSLKNLPAGALGVLGFSDLSRWYDGLRVNFANEADFRKSIQEMKTQTGLSLEADVLPALHGDFEVAVYPSTGKSKTPEFLAFSDSAHGASPADLTKKVVASMEAHATGWGNVKVTESQKGEATIYRVEQPKRVQPNLSAMNAQGLPPNAMAMAPNSAPPNGIPPFANVVPPAQSVPPTPGNPTQPTHGPYVDPNAPGMPPNIDMNAPGMPGAPMSNDTPDHADAIVLHGSVYVTSADDLTDKVVALGSGGESLATDAPFMAMQHSLEPTAQSILMVSIYRILQTYAGQSGDPDLNALFGGPNTGVVGSCHFNKATGTGDLFVPLDWGKAIHYIGKTMKAAKGGPRGSV